MGANGSRPHDDRWHGIERPYSDEDVERLRGSVVVEHTLARLGAERLWSLLRSEPFVPSLGALSGNQAVQMVKAGLPAIYVSGWQVAADANLVRPDLSRPEPLPGRLGAGARPPHQQRAPARRPDPLGRGRPRPALARPDRRRRGSRLRRPAQRLRADEVDDRSGRRGRALRGPARLREEVRPPRRQGARPDEPVPPHARRGAARSRRPRRADAPRRAHRRAVGDAADERRRRARPAVLHRRAHARGLLPHRGRARVRDRPLARLRALRRPDLVRDLDAGSRRGARVRAGDPRALPRQADGVQLLAVVQLEARTSTTRRSRPSSSSSASWATATSSSRSPASTR